MATLDIIIKQMILSAFRSANMTSASPGHVNHFIGLESQGDMGVIGSNDEINDAILEVVEGTMGDSDISDNSLDEKSKSGKNVKSATQKGMGVAQKGIGVAQNPASIVSMGLKFLPHAALIAFAISLAPIIFDILTKPGGALDLRFKRIINDEINAFISRQSQRDTEMGVRQVIIQSKTGFTATNGFNHYNTVKGIREGGINKEQLDRIGKVDHSKGVFDSG